MSTAQDRIRELLQELENEDGGDLVTAFVVTVKTALVDGADSTGYRHFWSGSVDERLGLLRFATLRTEHDVFGPGEEED